MKKRTPPQHNKDLERVRAVLKVREKQFRQAVATLKAIVAFKSAHQSMFVTEVETLQRLALAGLCELSETQSGRKGRVRLIRQRVIDVRPRRGLAMPLQRIRLEDEDV